MSGKIVYITRSQNKIYGFQSLVSSLEIGLWTVQERLQNQISSFGYTYELIDERDVQKYSDQIIFSNDTVFSDSLIKLVLDKKFKFSEQGNVYLNCHWNSSFCSLPEEIDFQKLPFEAKSELKIINEPLLKIDLNLPEMVYGKKKFVAAAVKYFYQKINDWPDLLKAQSLCSRELTAKSAFILRKVFSEKILLKLSQFKLAHKMSNKIGRNCRIHPTAIIEGCVIGDNVEVGPFCYLRACIVGSNVTIREHSSIKMSSVGNRSYILPCDILNCYIGSQACITTSILFHTVIGDGTFLGGAVGFADLNASRSNISMDQAKGKITSDQMFLGSMVAEKCFLGAGLLFHSGQRIHHSTTILNQEMIQKNDMKPSTIYAAKSNKLVSIPKQFLERMS